MAAPYTGNCCLISILVITRSHGATQYIIDCIYGTPGNVQVNQTSVTFVLWRSHVTPSGESKPRRLHAYSIKAPTLLVDSVRGCGRRDTSRCCQSPLPCQLCGSRVIGAGTPQPTWTTNSHFCHPLPYRVIL